MNQPRRLNLAADAHRVFWFRYVSDRRRGNYVRQRRHSMVWTIRVSEPRWPVARAIADVRANRWSVRLVEVHVRKHEPDVGQFGFGTFFLALFAARRLDARTSVWVAFPDGRGNPVTNWWGVHGIREQQWEHQHEAEERGLCQRAQAYAPAAAAVAKVEQNGQRAADGRVLGRSRFLSKVHRRLLRVKSPCTCRLRCRGLRAGYPATATISRAAGKFPREKIFLPRMGSRCRAWPRRPRGGEFFPQKSRSEGSGRLARGLHAGVKQTAVGRGPCNLKRRKRTAGGPD